jgi:hypothetical protein
MTYRKSVVDCRLDGSEESKPFLQAVAYWVSESQIRPRAGDEKPEEVEDVDEAETNQATEGESKRRASGDDMA